jgi:hypothetical protein
MTPREALAALLRDPEGAGTISPELRGPVLIELAALQTRIAAGMVTARAEDGAQSADPEGGMLTVDEACGRLGLTREQFYRRARRWPWVVKLGRRTMRVKAAGLNRYLAGKKP